MRWYVRPILRINTRDWAISAADIVIEEEEEEYGDGDGDDEVEAEEGGKLDGDELVVVEEVDDPTADVGREGANKKRACSESILTSETRHSPLDAVNDDVAEDEGAVDGFE